MKKFVVGDNIVTPVETISPADAGLTKKNCDIVFTEEQPYISWQPGRSINQIEELEEGKVYRVRMLKPSELKAFKDE